MGHTNAAKVQAIFETASKKALLIPCIIDDYNHYMGGVDIAIQLREYYGMEKNNTNKANTRSQVEELAKNIDADLSRIQYITNNSELSLIKLSSEGHLPK
ncbi:11803_t:CDS:2 [Dentiscutata erythropus]|uniref:11803_t:CDS:1 n=1 Tax=Dentiscutata erythropus TaxID=1348616 RepID=A0A9N9NI04_9GLOM|nr:11803_t:CDS:2 [Dentiscutata erythropus]